jgi:hypothetical protein
MECMATDLKTPNVHSQLTRDLTASCFDGESTDYLNHEAWMAISLVPRKTLM